MSEESDASRWLRHVGTLQEACAVGDVEAARTAWYELGLLLSHNAYLVLQPHDLPLYGNRELLADEITHRLQAKHQRLLGGAAGSPGVFDSAMLAVGRALLRQGDDYTAVTEPPQGYAPYAWLVGDRVRVASCNVPGGHPKRIGEEGVIVQVMPKREASIVVPNALRHVCTVDFGEDPEGVDGRDTWAYADIDLIPATMPMPKVKKRERRRKT